MPAEGGFTLVEVLAALAIAALTLVGAMEVMGQGMRVSTRLVNETAARDLVRRVLAEGVAGQGTSGRLGWSAVQQTGALQVVVGWPGGGLAVVEAVDAGG